MQSPMQERSSGGLKVNELCNLEWHAAIAILESEFQNSAKNKVDFLTFKKKLTDLIGSFKREKKLSYHIFSIIRSIALNSAMDKDVRIEAIETIKDIYINKENWQANMGFLQGDGFLGNGDRNIRDGVLETLFVLIKEDHNLGEDALKAINDLYTTLETTSKNKHSSNGFKRIKKFMPNRILPRRKPDPQLTKILISSTKFIQTKLNNEGDDNSDSTLLPPSYSIPIEPDLIDEEKHRSDSMTDTPSNSPLPPSQAPKTPRSKGIPSAPEVTPLDDQKQAEKTEAWETLLSNISQLAQERGLAKKVFISYAWPAAGEERDALHAFLIRLQDDLKRTGMHVFFDLYRMKGQLDHTMQANLEASDFVIPILTPKFLARVQETGIELNNLQFEFNLTMEKAKANPDSLLPILQSGEFGDVVLKEPLKPLAKYMVYTLQEKTKIESYLVGLSDPLGLIPVIYGLSSDDIAYRDLVLTWLESDPTRLPPKPLSNAISRSVQIANLFHPRNGKSVSVQIIQGIAGVGKTQLAAAYAHQAREDKKRYVHWISADSANLKTEWLRLGVNLGLVLKGKSLAEQKQAIRLALKKKKSWLIIFDGIENKEVIEEFLLRDLSPTQQILITTRSQDWDDSVLIVSPFTTDESQNYLKERLKEEQLEGSEKLTAALGDLPLALAHAVAYMQKRGMSAKEYHKLYIEQGIMLLADNLKTEATEANYISTLLNIHQISINLLAKKNPKAMELLKCCAYLDPENLNAWFLERLLNINNQVYWDCVGDSINYGLLTKKKKNLSMHCLLQAVVRHNQMGNIFVEYLEPMAKKLVALKEQTSSSIKAHALRLHLKSLLEHITEAVIPPDSEELAITCKLLLQRALEEKEEKEEKYNSLSADLREVAHFLKRDDQNAINTKLAQNPQLASSKELFLLFVTAGQQNRVKKMLETNLNFAQEKVTVTDLSGRTFENITGFQYAVWALDWNMWKMFFNPENLEASYLTTTQAALQCRALAQETWVKKYGSHFDFSQILDTLNIYKEMKHLSWDDREKYWCKEVGAAQLHLPIHIAHELCRRDYPFDHRKRNFTEELGERTIEIASSLNNVESNEGNNNSSVKSTWFSAQCDEGSANLGSGFAVAGIHGMWSPNFRPNGQYTHTGAIATTEVMTKCAERDHSTLSALVKTRQEQMQELKSQLIRFEHNVEVAIPAR